MWVQYLVLALLAPILLLSGKAAQLLRLPLITGYVLAGIILGPYGLTVLNAESLQSLMAVSYLQALLRLTRRLKENKVHVFLSREQLTVQ